MLNKTSTDHHAGQVAEYGTAEFEAHKSVFTSLAKGIYKSKDYGYQREIELYHRSEGYKPAGSCAIWTMETWGYRYELDGAWHGRMYDNEAEARAKFNELTGENS